MYINFKLKIKRGIIINTINSWIRSSIPSRATFVGDRKGSSVVDLIGAAAARSLAFVTSNIGNLGILIGIGLMANMGIRLIKGVSSAFLHAPLSKPLLKATRSDEPASVSVREHNRDSLQASLDIWVGLDISRRIAADRILTCYDRKGIYLDLSQLNLTTLPEEIGLLTHLTRLRLRKNQLTELPAEIGYLTNLTGLSLAVNQLRALPAEIGRLTHLITLNLSQNQLTALPAEIGRLTDLTILNLSQNQLTALPAEIGLLTNLNRLSLDWNQLTAFPAEIRGLTGILNRNVKLDASLLRHAALIPEGIGNRFLTNYPDLTQAERQSIITQGMRAVIRPRLHMQDAADVFDAVAAVPAAEREDVITHTLPLINERMHGSDIRVIILEVAAVRIEERPGYVAARMVANGMAGGARAAAEGVNVHAGNRDQKTKEAIELLRKHQGPITQDNTQRYVKEFKEYLDACERPEQDLAIRALLGPRVAGAHFGPLLDGELFSVNRLSLKGDEVTGRMWLYASTHPKVEEQAQAKEGMIKALADSYEHGSMVCNQGKTQRLAIRVLQGRLAGVNIDGLKVITAEQVSAEFFQNETNQKIEKLDELIQAAEAFVNDRPAITAALKEQFLEKVREYADLQGYR